MVCLKCGKTILDSAEICPFCNENLKQMASQNIAYTQENVISSQQDFNQSSKLLKSKRNFLIIAVVLVLVITVGIIMFIKFRGSKSNKYSNLGNTNSSEIVSFIRNENGTTKFIDGTFTELKVNNENDAYKALETLKDELKFQNVQEEFVIESKETSEEITYYRFQQKYKDINVYGMNLIISVNKDGNVLGMSGYYIPNIDIDINNKKTEEELQTIIKNDLGENAKIYSSEKLVYADEENQTLIFLILGYSDTKSGEYIVDANSGEIIASSGIENYASAYEFSGNGLNGQEKVTIEEFYDINVLKKRYRLVDPNRNIVIVDGSSFGVVETILLSFVFSNWSPMIGDLDENNFVYVNNMPKYANLSKIGITTMKQFEEIYDYYDKVLGRKSYDNRGGKIIVNIGIKEKAFGLKGWEQACWIGGLMNQMFIGSLNGVSLSAAKDTLAHEFTHGVVEYTSKFVKKPKKKDFNKAFETGALNEAYADILGSLIEGKNWLINDSILTVRSLVDPSIYKDATIKGGEYYYPDGYLKNGRTLEQFLADNSYETVYSYDEGGVHQNATVVGHAAYLMYENGAFSSREEMAKVWYNSLFLLSSYATFEDCALAVIKTAKNQGLSSESIKIIEEAFMETKMLEDTRVEIKGNVSSGEEKLSDVKIVLKAMNRKNTDYAFTTDSNGNFSEKIQAGTYELAFTKDNFEDYKIVLTIRGDSTINVELASIKKKEEDQKNNKKGLNCSGKNCHTLTIYFLENLNNTGLKENYEIYSVEHGTVMGTDVLINTVNSTLGGNLIKTDGKTFTITINGFSVDFAWYYKGTNTKFDFNKPIVEDTEIEMKMFDGMIDNNTLQGIYDIFNP